MNDLFDAVYCINLKERADKRYMMQKIFNYLNLNVDFYIVEKHVNGGREGCFTSHINLIKQSYNNDALKHILIFEDDAIPTMRDIYAPMKNAIEFMRANPQYEYMQLGYTILPHEFFSYFTAPMLSKNVLKYNGNTTHAYMLNRNGMKRILDSYEVYKDLHLDLYYKIIFSNNGACVCPLIFDQQFCLVNNNEVPTSLYYNVLRDLSCVSTKTSFMYLLSILRMYLVWFFLLTVIIICLLIFMSLLIYRKCYMK